MVGAVDGTEARKLPVAAGALNEDRRWLRCVCCVLCAVCLQRSQKKAGMIGLGVGTMSSLVWKGDTMMRAGLRDRLLYRTLPRVAGQSGNRFFRPNVVAAVSVKPNNGFGNR